ncbi:MAG: magnesium/cobalt transporter CorA [Burkholderiaceae bacterium]
MKPQKQKILHQRKTRLATIRPGGSFAGMARRAPPGTMPGTVESKADAGPAVLNTILYDSNSFSEQIDSNIDAIEALDRTEKTLWVDVSGLADTALIERLGETFGLHRLTLEDVVSPHQRPKIEEFDDYVFIVLRMPEDGKGSVTEQFSLLLGHGFLLTFQERPGDCFNPVRERLRKSKGRIRQAGADYLSYTLIDTVIDSFYPLFEQYGETLEQLEDEVVEHPDPGLVRQLHQLRRDMLALRRVIWPTRELVNTIIRDETPIVTEATRLYFRDCYDHVIQLMDIVETYREVAAGLLDVYLSSMSTRLNEVMKVLTIIATIFIPLSFITGLFGMNFDRSVSPWNMPELGWQYGYPLALLLMATVAGGLIYFFRRKGWIGKQH